MSRPVIITIGKHRIVKRNSLNLEIEKLEQANLSKNPEIAQKQLENGLEEKWTPGHGFYGNLAQALVKVHNKTINSVESESVSSLLEAIRSSEEAITDKVAEMECPEQLTREDIEMLIELNEKIEDPKLTALLEQLTEE